MSETPRTDRETYTVKQCDVGFRVIPVSLGKILEREIADKDLMIVKLRSELVLAGVLNG